MPNDSSSDELWSAAGAAPMHSVPMQGGMPMAMPQTMYMAPGQQPMYVPGPAYGMPPGATLLSGREVPCP